MSATGEGPDQARQDERPDAAGEDRRDGTGSANLTDEERRRFEDFKREVFGGGCNC